MGQREVSSQFQCPVRPPWILCTSSVSLPLSIDKYDLDLFEAINCQFTAHNRDKHRTCREGRCEIILPIVTNPVPCSMVIDRAIRADINMKTIITRQPHFRPSRISNLEQKAGCIIRTRFAYFTLMPPAQYYQRG